MSEVTILVEIETMSVQVHSLKCMFLHTHKKMKIKRKFDSESDDEEELDRNDSFDTEEDSKFDYVDVMTATTKRERINDQNILLLTIHFQENLLSCGKEVNQLCCDFTSQSRVLMQLNIFSLRLYSISLLEKRRK